MQDWSVALFNCRFGGAGMHHLIISLSKAFGLYIVCSFRWALYFTFILVQDIAVHIYGQR